MSKQLNLKLSDEQYSKIKQYAELDDRSIQYAIRKLIDDI